MIQDNYYFIDGSALMAQIRALRKANSKYIGKKLNPIKFIEYFCSKLLVLGSNSYKRAVFYFPQGERLVDFYFENIDIKSGNHLRDLHYKFCGSKLNKSDRYQEWVSNSVPDEFLDFCSKGEKGVDIEICCDALQLASLNKLERLFILTNDADFLPLIKSLKNLGSNISLLFLSEFNTKNKLLIAETDTYDYVQEGGSLDYIFDVKPEVISEEPLPIEPPFLSETDAIK